MNNLLKRKTRLVVQTENCVWERGRTRPIVAEFKADWMELRAKGTRAVYCLSYTSALNLAIRNEIFRKKMEKLKANKKGTQ